MLATASSLFEEANAAQGACLRHALATSARRFPMESSNGLLQWTASMDCGKLIWQEAGGFR
jgi:hypothetical protein